MTDKKPDKTSKKHALTPAMEAVKWVAGQSGNPKGRTKGNRSKFSEAFISDILECWQSGGKETIERVRNEDPSTFLRVAASLVPKEFNVSKEDTTLERLLDNHSIDDLDRLIAGLVTLGASGSGKKSKAEEAPSKQPDSVH